MDDWDDFRDFVEMRYDSMAFSDYSGFVRWLEGFCERSEKDFSDWIERYPDPGIQVIPSELIEDEEEGELWYPPDTGPLADYEDHGWMDDQDMDCYRKDPLYKMVRGNQSIKEPEVLDDILENTLHILGRCNQPDDWGDEDRRGLVYGMIQSGKTASMINLITSGMKAGYKVFIVLSGDKDSLRIQTQDRVNSSFNLVNGANQHYKIHSPTHDGDFQDKDAMSHSSAFKCVRRLRNGEEYSTVFVIKKNPHVIPKLIACIESLRSWCQDQSGRGFDFSEDYKCMIIDDEADYASQDTDSENEGSTIHNHIRDIRLIDGFRNCYIAYTATPQACLSANPEDVIGYPRDFFWVLEPYMDQVGEEGEYKPRSYLGAYELFNDFDYYLVKDIENDEWPHHQRGMDGRYLGLWVPPMGEGGTGEVRRSESLPELENNFLKLILDENSPVSPPETLKSALHNHIITCAVSWFRHWKKKRRRGQGPPTESEVFESYPYHGTMVHLSRLVEHQEMCMRVVRMVWDEVVEEWEGLQLPKRKKNKP